MTRLQGIWDAVPVSIRPNDDEVWLPIVARVHSGSSHRIHVGEIGSHRHISNLKPTIYSGH
jgi:hypothetical protein